MGVSRYNSEGYYDPTAYEALTKIVQEEKAARYRPLVYICSPYSGDTEGNTEKARRYIFREVMDIVLNSYGEEGYQVYASKLTAEEKEIMGI